MRIFPLLHRRIESPAFVGFCVSLIAHIVAGAWFVGVFWQENLAEQGSATITMSLASINTNATEKAYSKPTKSQKHKQKAHKKKHKSKNKIPTKERLSEQESKESTEMVKSTQTTAEDAPNEEKQASNQTTEGSTQEMLAHNEGIDDEFYRQIEAAIARKHDYPQMAQIRGMQGVVVVEFFLNPDGSVDGIRVVRSNTGNLLNKQAVQTIKAAHKQFPKPEKRVWMKIPINYGLEQS